MNASEGAGYGTKSSKRGRMLAMLLAIAALLACAGLVLSVTPTADGADEDISTQTGDANTPTTEGPDIITIAGNKSSGLGTSSYKTLSEALAALDEIRISNGSYTFTIIEDCDIDQDIVLPERGRIVVASGVTVTMGDVSITGTPHDAAGLVVVRGNLTLNGTDVITGSNHAIRMYSGSLKVMDGTVRSNGGIDGTTAGAGVYIGGGTVTIETGSFHSVKSNSIYVNSKSAKLEINDGSFSNEGTISQVIDVNSGTATIKKGTFTSLGTASDLDVGGTVTIGAESSNVAISSIVGTGGVLTLSNATVTDVTGYFGEGSDLTGGSFLNEISDVLPEGEICVKSGDVWTVKEMEDKENEASVKRTSGGTPYYYATLKSAVRDFVDGDTLTLLKDCVSDTYVDITGSWTGELNLNGHTYKYIGNEVNNNYAIRIGSGTSTTYKADGFRIVGPGSVVTESTSAVALYLYPNTSSTNHPLNITIDETVSVSSLEMIRSSTVLYTEYLADRIVNGGFVFTDSEGETFICGSPTSALIRSADGTAYLLSDHSGALTLGEAGSYELDLRGNTLSYSTDVVKIDGNNVDLKITNGAIVATSKADSAVAAVINKAYNDSSMTFVDVDLSSAGYWGINFNGTSNNIDLNIDGGTVSSAGMAIYYPVTGTLTLTDTKVTAPSGVQFCGAGELIIEGSTITATADKLEGPTKDPSEGDGSIDDGAAVSIVTRGGGYQQSGETISVSITNSKLISLNNAAYQDYRYQRVTTDGEAAWVSGESTSLTSAVQTVEIGGGTEIAGASGSPPVTTDTQYATDVYAVSDVVLSSTIDANLLADGYSQQTVEGAVVVSGASEGASDYSVKVNGSTVYTNDLNQAYSLVGDNGVITVLRDASISGITFDEEKSVTLALGEFKLTVSDDSTGLTVSAGEVTVTATTGGIASSTAYALIRNNATLVIEGGDYDASNTTYGRVLVTGTGSDTTINGGTFDSTYSVVYNNGFMEINGGTFTSTACSHAECDGDHSYAVINTGDGTMIINGKGADGATTVNVYGSQGALSSAYGKLEVNGGHFETKPCPKGHTGNVFYALYVAGEDGVTSAVINDGEFTSYNRPAAYIGNSHDGGLQMEATAVINGGSFSVTNPGAGTTIVYMDADTAAVPSVSITGGSYSIAPDTALLAPGLKVAGESTTGFTVSTIDEGEAYFSVTYDGDSGEVTYYEIDLARAFALAPSGSVIKVLKEVTLEGSITLDRDVDLKLTLDLNGNTIKTTRQQDAEGFYPILLEAGKLTITDLKVETAVPVVNTDDGTVEYGGGKLLSYNRGVVRVSGGSSLTLEGGTLESVVDDKLGHYGAVYVAGADVDETNTFTMTGGYIHADRYGAGAFGKNATITISGGAIVAEYKSAVAGNGSVGYGDTTITISGGTLVGKGSREDLHTDSGHHISCAVYHPQNGELTISGGTIVSLKGVGVLVRDGTLTMTGGEIIANGTDSGCFADAKASDIVPSAGIVVDIDAGYNSSITTMSVRLEGGSVRSDYENAVEFLAGETSAAGADYISISGGTYSSDVTEYTVSGLIAQETSDGVYGIVDGWTVRFTYDGTTQSVNVLKGETIDAAPGFTVDEGVVLIWSDDTGTYTFPLTPTEDLNLTATAAQSSLEVTISSTGSQLIGQSVTLTASATGTESVVTYVWTLEGNQISTGASITVRESGTYVVTATATETMGTVMGAASTTLNFVLPTYTVTFVYGDVKETVDVTSGDTAGVPKVEVPEGFEFVWITRSGNVWDPSSAIMSDMELTGELRILAPAITITQDMEAYTGATVTLAATFEEVEGMQYEFLWNTGETTPTVQVTESGTYGVTVTVSCEGYESVTATAGIAVEFRHVMVTFDLDGAEKTAETSYGGIVEAPDFGVSDGFHVIWTVDGQLWDESFTFTGDATVTGELALDAPVVDIVQDGHTITGVTVTLTAAILYNNDIGYSCEWSTGSTDTSIQVTESGTYSVTVTAQAMYLELKPVSTTVSVTLEFGEFGFVDDGITVYAGFGPYRPGLIGADDMEFSSSDDSVVTVDGNGKLTFEAEDLRRDTVVTITVTAQLDGQPLEDTYRMTVLSEHHDMVTGDDHHDPVVSVPSTSDSRDIWNEYLRPEVSAGDLPQTSRNDWTIVDIFIPDEDGHVAAGGTFIVPFDYFGVTAADGYVFHIVHIVGDAADILVEDVDFFVGDDGVTVTVESFSPFAFYAEPVTSDDPDTPVVPGGDDPSTPSQPSHPGYDDDEYVPPSGGTIIVTPGGSTTTTTTTDDDDDDMKVAIVACAAVGVLAALVAVFVWTDRKS